MQRKISSKDNLYSVPRPPLFQRPPLIQGQICWFFKWLLTSDCYTAYKHTTPLTAYMHARPRTGTPDHVQPTHTLWTTYSLQAHLYACQTSYRHTRPRTAYTHTLDHLQPTSTPIRMPDLVQPTGTPDHVQPTSTLDHIQPTHTRSRTAYKHTRPHTECACRL